MKKLGINYSRVFPDHRVPIDYHFNKELMQGPYTYFRVHFLAPSCSKTASIPASQKISTSTSLWLP